ncbi:cysteine hydrolase family protein [Rossellomorea sp. YZS02]|uniref:cysteine hydrolase family protein n=1 Tax=Rossellomorea sp. YZS02 TaxID=3097358 RepID=UPI002A146751|nr:cysteine hydrolase family protein [Rossellomorea sp. YZS02]MDX8342329.1 cysteine hydrolase family protein [Rossellomorea sp. YZS02]
MKQALLVIDVQQELVEGNEKEQAVFQKERLIETINGVIEKAKEADAHIVFIRDKDVAGGTGEGFQVHRDLVIPDHAEVFDKLATNSFYGTPLLSFLKDKEVEHVVIAGCQTEYCIDTAVRYATVSGFDVTLVADGHSTKDSPVLKAEQIIAHHNGALRGHYNVDHFSDVRPSEEDLFQPKHDEYRKEYGM